MKFKLDYKLRVTVLVFADALYLLSVSVQVLSTAENITKRLATEKACSWLSANVTGR